jgi:hypothetical protein
MAASGPIEKSMVTTNGPMASNETGGGILLDIY